MGSFHAWKTSYHEPNRVRTWRFLQLQLCGHSKFVLEATAFGFGYFETPQFLVVSCFVPPVWWIWSTFEVYLTWLTDCWMRLFTTLTSVLPVVLCSLSLYLSGELPATLSWFCSAHCLCCIILRCLAARLVRGHWVNCTSVP